MKNQYLSSLESMYLLLTKVGETRWAKWISQDLKQGLDSRHHLSSYGGMGSFNDVLISPGNGHQVTQQQKPWANVLFNSLKTLCYRLAQDTSRFFSLQELHEEVGLQDASLSAFIGGEHAPDSMRGLISESTALQGWRCLHCGYSRVGPEDIEWYLAENLIPGLVFAQLVSGELTSSVDGLMNGNINGGEVKRSQIKSAVLNGAINITTADEGRMRLCPKCSVDDTAVYRWKLDHQEHKMVPSSDNIPLRNH